MAASTMAGSTSSTQNQAKMSITTRTDKSLLMSILQHLIRPFGTSLIKPKKTYPAGSPQLSPPSSAKRKCTISERIVNDIYIYDFSPKHPSSESSPNQEKKRKRIFYFAGGGWQSPPAPEHYKLLCALTLRLQNTAISLISYPLAPSSPASSSYPHLINLYTTLLQQAAQQNEEVILAGDSAGGNIALSLPLHILSTDFKALAPSAIFAISPAVDLRPQDEKAVSADQAKDPLLTIPFINWTAKTWAGEWDASDARLTVLNAGLGVLKEKGVRVYGVSGSWDVLAPGAEAFAKECVERGVEGEWLDWRGQMHCFLLAWGYGLRESKVAMEWMVEVLGRDI